MTSQTEIQTIKNRIQHLETAVSESQKHLDEIKNTFLVLYRGQPAGFVVNKCKHENICTDTTSQFCADCGARWPW